MARTFIIDDVQLTEDEAELFMDIGECTKDEPYRYSRGSLSHEWSATLLGLGLIRCRVPDSSVSRKIEAWPTTKGRTYLVRKRDMILKPIRNLKL